MTEKMDEEIIILFWNVKQFLLDLLDSRQYQKEIANRHNTNCADSKVP